MADRHHTCLRTARALTRRARLFLGLFVVVLAIPPAPADEPSPPALPPTLAGATNLCRRLAMPEFSGSLGERMSEAVATGRDPALRQIRMPPQDLIVRWPSPVTIGAHFVAWESADVHGLWFGLEYWDADARRFVTLYEIRDNHAATTLREFPPVTTTEVRFTIFDHVLRYDSVVMRQFALFGTATP